MNDTHSGEITLREATRADLCRIAAWLGPGGDKFAGGVQGFERALDGHKLYLGLAAGTPVAALTLSFGDEEVDVIIVVDPAARGRGFGRAVLEELEHLPAVASCTAITASVRAENVGSLRMLEAAGYVRTDEADPSDPESHHGYRLGLPRRQ